jgi:hypothetical protein
VAGAAGLERVALDHPAELVAVELGEQRRQPADGGERRGETVDADDAGQVDRHVVVLLEPAKHGGELPLIEQRDQPGDGGHGPGEDRRERLLPRLAVGPVEQAGLGGASGLVAADAPDQRRLRAADGQLVRATDQAQLRGRQGLEQLAEARGLRVRQSLHKGGLGLGLGDGDLELRSQTDQALLVEASQGAALGRMRHRTGPGYSFGEPLGAENVLERQVYGDVRKACARHLAQTWSRGDARGADHSSPRPPESRDELEGSESLRLRPV